jgi:hypothetical protein
LKAYAAWAILPSTISTKLTNVRCYGTPKRLSRMDVLETLAMLGTQEAGRK